MSPDYLRAAVFPGYGVTMYVGIGVPIPILDADMARFTAVRDEEITTEILDFGVPRRNRPVIRKVSYAELKSGKVEINGEEVRVSSLSSQYIAEKITRELKKMIEKGEFFLTQPVERIPRESAFKPMRQREVKVVRSVMTPILTISPETTIEQASRIMIQKGINHLPVVNENDELVGIVTSWDVAKAVATGKIGKVADIMTRKVITTSPDEPIEVAARKMEKHGISALPVVEQKRVLGLVTSEDLSKLLAR
jgi:CBS domain-containing protein